MGSRFATPNSRPPVWLVQMTKRPPKCMSVDQWSDYLEGVRGEAFQDNAMKKRLERGVPPNHCAGCTPAYRHLMEQQGRCEPFKHEARETA